MPHNTDAEAALLGCIINDGDVQTDILEGLREEDFYSEKHRIILRAMKAIFAARMPVDVVTLADRLEHDGNLDSAGGVSYLTDLTQLLPSSANYRQYAEILRRDSVNRELIRVGKSIIETGMKGEDEGAALSHAEKLVYDVSRQENGSNLSGLGDGEVISSVIEKFEAIQSDPNAMRGVETGFKHLDRITNGLQRSDLIVIAARPGMGKTSLAMNIVEHACLKKNGTAAVFSLEMPRIQIVQRLLCSYAEVSMEKALSGKLVQRDWKNLMVASEKMRKSKIFIDDSSRITPAEILSKCRRLKSAEGALDLVMIDYIQLMGGDKKSFDAENRTQEVAYITKNLKIMAKELDVPVIALSQLRRIQTKEAQLSDLRESGAIEQDADIVMFINRPDVGATPEELQKGNIVKGAAELVIAKHRNGPPGRIQLRFLGESTKFIDVDEQGAPQEEPRYSGEEPPPYEGEVPPDEGGVPFD